MLIGEWGGFMEGDTLKWMNYLRQLIDEKKLNHTFWCFNANSGDTGGLVKDDFKTWDEDKYNLVKKVLWQNDDGKFVGLDHKVPLGANGISLSDFSGKIVTAAPDKTVSESSTEAETTQAETSALPSAETTAAAAEPVSGTGVVRRIVLAVIIIIASVGVLLFAVVAGIRAAGSKTSADKEGAPEDKAGVKAGKNKGDDQ